MSESGNIARIAWVCGKITIACALVAISAGWAAAQVYAINCYDTTTGEAGFYLAKMKFINLDAKQIIDEVIIADEGGIINIIPIEVPLVRDTMWLAALTSKCYCKNTTIGNYDARIVAVSKRSQNILRQVNFPGRMIYALMKDADHRFFLGGFQVNADTQGSVDGVYEMTRDFRLERVGLRPSGYMPNTIRGLTGNTYSKLIADDLFFAAFADYFYVIKTDANHEVFLDTLRCFPLESRSQIFALKDSMLYIFSLNYEVHISGRVEKGYGQDWIDSNVRIVRVSDFTLADSINVPDYPEGEFVDWETAAAEVSGAYIVYYFGQSGDMELLYPAMLFIFDTRTNEATWLRVGWR